MNSAHEYCLQLRKISPHKEGIKYTSDVDILCQYGREFKPGVLAFLGMPMQCFRNAYKVAVRSRRYVYAEGYATPILRCSGKLTFAFPMPHGWLVDTYTGQTVETTWERPAYDYFGVTVRAHILPEIRRQNGGDYSVLFAWQGKHFRDIYAGRVPLETVFDYEEAA